MAGSAKSPAKSGFWNVAEAARMRGLCPHAPDRQFAIIVVDAPAAA